MPALLTFVFSAATAALDKRPSEAAAAKAFARERVPLVAHLGDGSARSRLLAADLGHEYVSENADYRS